MITIKKFNESWLQLSGDRDEIFNVKEHFKFRPNNFQWSKKYKSGVWDGYVHLMNNYNRLPIGLFKRLKILLGQINIEYDNQFSKTSVKISDEAITKYSKDVLKMDIDLRDYQLSGIREGFAQQKMVLLSPTSSGKSAILYVIAKLFDKLKKGNSKTLLIVPNVSLVEQMRGDFLEYSENMNYDMAKDIRIIYSGKEKINDKKIIISTWQSLSAITDPKFFQSFDMVLVDEIQSAEKGVIIQNIISSCVNAEMKIGVSGTINDEMINRVQLEGLFGQINQFTTTKKLMNNGTISTLRIVVPVLNYGDDDRRECYKKEYPDEIKFLINHEKRLKLITKTAQKINKNVLILFKNLKYGEKIYETLIGMNLNRNVHYVSGMTKTKIREEVKKIALDDHNGIIVASLGVFAVGINIPVLDYVLFSQPWKSKIKVVQSIGRVLRKTQKKNKATLIDFVDDLKWRRRRNYALKHGMSRLDIYDREEFDYDIKEIDMS